MEIVIPYLARSATGTITIDDRVYQVPLLDSSGRQIVVGIGAGGAIEAIQDTPADLKTAVHGLDGATQRQIKVDSSGRLMPTDIRERSPVMITAQYAVDNVAPHASTQRWIYTVPAGKKAIIESLYGLVGRSAAAVAAGMAFSRIQLTPSGVASAIIVESRIYTNGVGDKWIEALALNLLMVAGDSISSITIDQSNGGTFTYILTMKATQFDA